MPTPIETAKSIGASESTIQSTYPHYEPYWYAGTDYYSTTSVNLTLSMLAGIIAGALTLDASSAIAVASGVYTFLPAFASWDNLYFKTDRYYAYYALSSHGPVTFYSKFITTAYYDRNRLNKVSGYPITKIFEGPTPI